jgi:hypothetical protein
MRGKKALALTAQAVINNRCWRDMRHPFCLLMIQPDKQMGL